MRKSTGNKEKEQHSLSSDRLLKIIEGMAANRLPMKLAELAEKQLLPPATLLRYLRTLISQGYVYQDEQSGGYALTWKICKIGDAVKVNLVLRSLVAPFLNMLSNNYNVSTCLVIPVEQGAMYLDFIEKPCGGMNTLKRIGKSAPMHSTGSGKLLLSTFSERKVNDYIEQVGLVKITTQTIDDRDVLMSELKKIREQGYALDNEECEEGVRCVSVPLRDYSGSVIAAISIVDDVPLLTDERIQEEILPVLNIV